MPTTTIHWSGKLKGIGRESHPENLTMYNDCLHIYFKDTHFNNYGVNQPYIANFHCSCNAQPTTYGKTVTIPPGPDESLGCSRSFFYSTRNVVHVDHSPHIGLEYLGKIIGVLSPATQTLWATAWTHLSDYRNTVRHVITFLAEQNLIKPRPVVEEDHKPTFTITMGGDPEFELVDFDDNRVSNANSVGGFYSECKHGNIGVDGSGYQIELRPSPGEPETVVNNIHGLLKEFGRRWGEKWRLAASSDRYPCGGHIHIGVSPAPAWEYYDSLTVILNDFIGRPAQGLNGDVRKRSGEYGRIGDWRTQPYGMEYRTPPNTVWKNPEFTRVTLKLAYNLAEKFANNLSVVYVRPITHIELLTVGGLSEEEASFFLTECQKTPPVHTECLLAAWNIELPKQKIEIRFHGLWSSRIKELLTQEFASIELNKRQTLFFYGLGKHRGDVFTFPVPGYTEVDHPKIQSENYFGFSYNFRTDSTFDATIVQALRREIEHR